ncbi:MAG: 1,4-alpha-glucan branching protein GlgB [Oscillospiraceae bacterium]|nr:1,4-alpha-glucan branching protein GlgB [Oscillospiraceae bacterium]
MSKQTAVPEGAIDKHLYFFHEGSDCRAYEFMGARKAAGEGGKGWVFRVWAPEASAVSVLGDFNAWNPQVHKMSKISVGVWELFIPNLKEYDAYKYGVFTKDGRMLEKTDPYGYHCETRPKTASKLYDLDGYKWDDGDWVAARSRPYDKPMNIYEVHLGSWRRGDGGALLTYTELAERLSVYVKEMGFTHIELMPVTEYPSDSSWGYQVTGYFAPTSRHGTPKDFMRFVDIMHQSGVGVLLDWVPAHFIKDGHGLIEFDGSFCYEYNEPTRREHTGWGTRVFDYGRNEVRSFLLSGAIYWLDKYHIDGLRVDAVASMLYLDYARGGDYVPNIYGGRENLEAVDFLRKLSEQVFAAFPHTLLMAEESTAWPMVTKPTYMGGLGFNFKWNMGWMNDTLHYMKLDPVYRQYNHSDLTFSMMYAFSENYILPLSHDEVVHGKCSIIEKMPGYYPDKFAGVRAYLSFQMAHPGKQLLFMGGEFGQFIEWTEANSLDWHLLGYELHAKLHEYVKTLNMLYLSRPEFWEDDCSWQGFRWLNHGDYQGNTLSFCRVAKSGSEVVCVFNFSPLHRSGYRLGVPRAGTYREILNSNAAKFGGWGYCNNHDMYADPVPCNAQQQSIMLDLPPFSAVFLEVRGP